MDRTSLKKLKVMKNLMGLFAGMTAVASVIGIIFFGFLSLYLLFSESHIACLRCAVCLAVSIIVYRFVAGPLMDKFL